VKWPRILIATFIAAFLLSPSTGVEACGPGFEPDTFIRTNAPDDLAAFAKGELSLLERGFDSNEFAVAYRYLNGGKLTDAEREAYAPAPGPTPTQDWRNFTPAQIQAAREAELKATEDAQQAGKWLLDRAKYVPGLEPDIQKQSFPVDYDGSIVFDPNYLNCPNPAFQNAVLTLDKRSAAWGRQSPWLVDWIHGQDAVFSNCAGKNAAIPSAAPADSPTLLREDRAYQAASASFYARQFEQAAQQFEAIAHDDNSPWKDWGMYLAARATVRKAFAMGKQTDPYSGDVASYDADTMLHAQQILESLLTESNPKPSRKAIDDELNFIRIRTEPEKRMNEICAALAGPAPDANFKNDLADLDWLLKKQIAIKNSPPLLAWIKEWRTPNASSTAFATWQQNRALPWLVMAMVQSDSSDKSAPELLAAAEKIKPGSPAYDTLFYHRVRLLIGLKRADEARSLLDRALAAMHTPSSNRNALLAERLSVARSFDEFLAYAPRTDFAANDSAAGDWLGECMQDPAMKDRPADCPVNKQPLELDEDAVNVLNRQTPLSLLIDAANAKSLPENLQHNIALAAWTRAVALEDTSAAARLAPLLPRSLNQTASTGAGFQAVLAILRNPGLRPFLEPGVSRLSSYRVFDNFRDNWWCNSWEGQQEVDKLKQSPVPSPELFTKEQKAANDAELQRLQSLPASAALLGRRVIDYSNSHPDDPEVAEALALTVRATHYGCDDQPAPANGAKSDSSIVSKAAFDLLHKRYPKSPWTAKTPYYY
jgi:hypothetical protein